VTTSAEGIEIGNTVPLSTKPEKSDLQTFSHQEILLPLNRSSDRNKQASPSQCMGRPRVSSRLVFLCVLLQDNWLSFLLWRRPRNCPTFCSLDWLGGRRCSLGPSFEPQDIIAATFAYAAVLVVFAGAIIAKWPNCLFGEDG